MTSPDTARTGAQLLVDALTLHGADMAFCVKYFPHYDEYLQGERAARMLVRAIRGDYKPATVTIKVPIATPTVIHPTERNRRPSPSKSRCRSSGGSTWRSTGAPTTARKSIPPSQSVAARM